MDYREIITIELDKTGGKPCVRGIRIKVYDVLYYLASGITEAETLADFSDLTSEDIRACLAFSAIANVSSFRLAGINTRTRPGVARGRVVSEMCVEGSNVAIRLVAPMGHIISQHAVRHRAAATHEKHQHSARGTRLHWRDHITARRASDL